MALPFHGTAQLRFPPSGVRSIRRCRSRSPAWHADQPRSSRAPAVSRRRRCRRAPTAVEWRPAGETMPDTADFKRRLLAAGQATPDALAPFGWMLATRPDIATAGAGSPASCARRRSSSPTTRPSSPWCGSSATVRLTYFERHFKHTRDLRAARRQALAASNTSRRGGGGVVAASTRSVAWSVLQHDLGEPHPVRIGRLAARRAPRQHAPMAVVPGEQRGRLRPDRSCGRALSRLSASC